MKSSRKILSILMIVILLTTSLTACGNQESADSGVSEASTSSDLEGTISISGAFALYPMMQRWAEEFSKLHPKVMFDVQAGGAGKGMSDALADLVDIGMVSRDIAPEEEAKGAYGIAVTKDAVFATISDQNPVLQDLLAKGLTMEQFEKLFITGEITTWGESGRQTGNHRRSPRVYSCRFVRGGRSLGQVPG